MVMPSASNHAPNDFSNEREILYKLFFDMKKDVTELKKMFLEILKNPSLAADAQETIIQKTRQSWPEIVVGGFHRAHRSSRGARYRSNHVFE